LLVVSAVSGIYGEAEPFLSQSGNERLQEMMGLMAEERGGQIFATDERLVVFEISRG